MTQYRYTSTDSTLFLNKSRVFANLPADLTWVPVKQLPDAKVIKDYELTKVGIPIGSVIGEAALGVMTSRLETERNVLSLRYEFTFNKTELAIAQRNGYSLVNDALNVGAIQMNKKIAQLLFQGTYIPNDRVNISGMLDVGTDVTTSGWDLSVQYWSTATKPVFHCAAGFRDLITAHYAPPYHWILSYSLLPGLAALNNAANPKSHREICRDGYQIEGFHFYHADTVSNTGEKPGTGGPEIYPLPLTGGQDGVWLMCQVSPENFFMGQMTNGIEISELTFDRKTNSYSVFMEWRGAPVFRGATVDTAGTAEYILWEDRVDLAT